jgi:hypothetical protein
VLVLRVQQEQDLQVPQEKWDPLERLAQVLRAHLEVLGLLVLEIQERLDLQEQPEMRALQVQAELALQELLVRLEAPDLLDQQARQALLAFREQLELLGPQEYQERQALRDKQVQVARQGLLDLVDLVEQLVELA